jgi:GNAT superfamily N-acetyltransferase
VIVDAFGDRSIHEITACLSAVGLSSPPSWLKTFDALSHGEQFRCNLARALASDEGLIVFDEFTSVVDRTVARIGSAAVSKAVRRSAGRQFVAVSCHYDIREWLEPDWVLDMASGELSRGRLRRPGIQLELRAGSKADWAGFAPHHYLTAALHPGGRYYLGVVEAKAVGFVATLPTMGHAGARRIHRVVVLPDYQGVGIGMALLGAVAEEEKPPAGMTIRTSHAALIKALQRSASWVAIGQSDGTRAQNKGIPAAGNQPKIGSHGRITVSFKYRQPNPGGLYDESRGISRQVRQARRERRGARRFAGPDGGPAQGARVVAEADPRGGEDQSAREAA